MLKKHKTLTMALMADELGVSQVTVSSVVNGQERRQRLSAATVQRVKEHIVRRGYVPSAHACGLRSTQKRVVGLLHVDTLYSHLVIAFHQLAVEFSSLDLGLEIMVTPRARLNTAVRELLARQVTDLIWIHDSSVTEDYRNKDIANYLSNMRVIVYNYMFNSLSGETELLSRGLVLVGVDRLAYTRQLAGFLRRMGHKTIALPDIPIAALNPAYSDAFQSEGLSVAECPGPFCLATLLNAMRRRGVTAACFHGDNAASLALCNLRAAGVRVPEDLTVTGFDGMSRFYNPDLTTLAIPVEKMVAKIREIVTGSEHGLRHCFDLELVKGRTHGLTRSKS